MIDILNKCTLQEVRPSPFHPREEGLLLVVNIQGALLEGGSDFTS